MRFIILILLLNLSGCSSLFTKANDFGHPYNGVTYAAETGVCLTSYAAQATYEYPFLFPIVIFPPLFAVVDITASAVLDTVLLPLDYLKMMEEEGKEKNGIWFKNNRVKWNDKCNVH